MSESSNKKWRHISWIKFLDKVHMTLVHMKPCVGGVKRTQTTILKMHLIPGWIHAREQDYTTVLLWLPVTLTHVYFHLWTTDIKKNGLWWPKHVLSFSNNHNISDLHCTVFPNISSYRSEYMQLTKWYFTQCLPVNHCWVTKCSTTVEYMCCT